ncbi:MmgE/PrpD family protein [Ensifer sp. YR511]|uniref:MmgE/PrpD family protein n=1 Tax=Ensifer sp. YR511 TaxID=1855294 RepID=UPI000887FB5D|nr:MmgE/PrpD family protein [Ensifer sp. YR511]SDN41141.1 2-methylcitrate dehydratase PrpD [Ensifer sp. YR511]
MQPVTRIISEFIANTKCETLPVDLRRKAETIVIDTFAAIVSGAGSETAPSLMRYIETAGMSGNVPVLGTDVQTSAELAAFVNGTFGHALEYDDVFSMLPGHPAAVMVAAMIGDIAATRVSGEALTGAFIVGYEVCARIGIAMTLEHHRLRGFHATSTLGVFAAAAALSKLRSYDAEQTARTLSIAASFSSGLLGQTGSSMKPVHSGWAARNAVAAADLARNGLDAVTDIFEAPRGFFNAYGTQNSCVERVVEDIGEPWAILKPGVSLKKYPCCFAAHRGIEAVLHLRKEHDLHFADVKHIECRLPPKGLVNMVYTRPRTGLQAKFSMEYAFLAALHDGEATLSTFSDGAVQREVMQNNLHMVSNVEDPACEEGLGEASGEISGARGHVQITITTKSGKSYVRKVAHAPGTPVSPLSPADLREKIGICANHAGMSREQAADLETQLLSYGEKDDLKQLLGVLGRKDPDQNRHVARALLSALPGFSEV